MGLAGELAPLARTILRRNKYSCMYMRKGCWSLCAILVLSTVPRLKLHSSCREVGCVDGIERLLRALRRAWEYRALQETPRTRQCMQLRLNRNPCAKPQLYTLPKRRAPSSGATAGLTCQLCSALHTCARAQVVTEVAVF